MKLVIAALTTVFLITAAQVTVPLLGDVSLTREITSVEQPVDESAVTVASSQCSTVKMILGEDYDQVKGSNEPDLNQLTLDFISRDYKITYNLSAVATLLPLTPGYNPENNLIIYMHGFTDNPTKESFSTINDAFMAKGEYNILALDASSLIQWLYLRSTTYVRFIGARLGEVLAALVNLGMNPSKIHLIGHSLGAHISSFAGKSFTALTGQQLGRISGLDPAGPCYTHIDEELRLKSTDAAFVDVIHTDAGVYGLKQAMGNVDFYPNGGSQQPNCLNQTCSHGRVWLLYAESIMNTAAFSGVACNSWDEFRQGLCSDDVSLMGYGTEASTQGIFYLRTAESSPYGLGQAGLVYVNNEGIIRNVGNVLPIKDIFG